MKRHSLVFFGLILLMQSSASALAQAAVSDSVKRHELFILVEGPHLRSNLLGAIGERLPGYEIRDFGDGTRANLADSNEIGYWFIATPVDQRFTDGIPWEEAHQAAKTLDASNLSSARASRHRVYVEPNVENLRPSEDQTAHGPLPPDWPNGDRFAWHLEDGYTELGAARMHTKAGGCIPRITILDTGIYPPHHSTPRNVQKDLQFNFFDGDKVGFRNVTDPGTSGALIKNPMHGTGTIGILAGGKVLASENPDHYEGDLGGAPDAEVVPVRIGDSVVHFWTKEMGQGIQYATQLPDAGIGKYCDVVSISAGGLPSRLWASAVNDAYQKGIVIVAASGDNFRSLPTRFTVYPSRFSRVVVATGAMANYLPYQAPQKNQGSLQGNYGPDSVMENAVAAYTPNIPWAKWKTTNEYDLDGGGTSAATPQIAAAFALWLQTHAVQDGLVPGPAWVEGSMQAIFESADRSKGEAAINKKYFGNGLLRADHALQRKAVAPLRFERPAEVSFPFWRILFGLGEPLSNDRTLEGSSAMTPLDRMYELEAMQLALQSAELAAYAGDYSQSDAAPIRGRQKRKFMDALIASKATSKSLREFLIQHR